MKGIVFDIQTYAIYDGPGIRTLIFLKGCPLSCLWCQNPESQLHTPQISYFREKCTKCGKCIETCPNRALSLSDDEILRNKDLCIICGSCVEACPSDAVEIIGQEKTIDELIGVILRDKPFYDNSGGGVTISGGEPTLQGKFLLKLLATLKKEGIHTAIETCGHFNKELREKLPALVDLFLFDVKLVNSIMHERYTGVKNEGILDNFRFLLSKVGNERIIPRIPLIPNFNANKFAIQKIISFLKSTKYEGQVHLMPYNKLAKTKYEKVGMGAKYHDFGELSNKIIDEIVRMFESESLEVLVQH